MAGDLWGRHYLAFDAAALDIGEFIDKHGHDRVADALGGCGLAYKPLSSPSHWNAVFEHEGGPTHHDGAKAGPGAARTMIGAVRFTAQPGPQLLQRVKPVSGLSFMGADLPVRAADYWNPAESFDPIFATRRRAHDLMGIGARSDGDAGLTGVGTNVVIVDQGLDADYIRKLGGNFAGGWFMPGTSEPGQYPTGHGSMLARNVIAVAPDATLFDAPVIPVELEDTRKFISTVHAAFEQIVVTIEILAETGEPQWLRPWVFVNAWATFNRGQEFPQGNYSSGEQHRFNQLVRDMAGRHDMVFAAGNCGQFCPSWRCGIDDVGPDHSIIGANSLAEVLTVGAVRADGMWLGYSSQGPGTLAREKPDLCAASQFAEDGDATMVNTGTSAACALAAGQVAALRGKYGGCPPGTAAMKELLIATTTLRPALPQGAEWDGQFGHGVINLAGACEEAHRRGYWP